MIITEIIVVGTILAGLCAFFAGKSGLFRSAKNKMDKAARDLNEQIRDKVADGEAAIRKGEQELQDLKKQKRSVASANEILQRRITAEEQQVSKYDGLAASAGKAGKMDAVKAFVVTMKQHAAKLAVLRSEAEKNDLLMSQYEKQITALNANLEQARFDIDNLTTRKALEDFREKQERSKIDSSGTLAELARLRQDTEVAEANASALAKEDAELTELQKHEEEFTGETDNSLDAEIAKYMTPASSVPENLGPKVKAPPEVEVAEEEQAVVTA